MGLIQKLGSGRIGKTFRWMALGTALMTGTGVMQNVASYQLSRDQQADTFVMQTTAADAPDVKGLDSNVPASVRKAVDAAIKQVESNSPSQVQAQEQNTVETSERAAEKAAVTETAKEQQGTSVEIRVPASTVKKFISTVENTAQTREKLNSQISKVTQSVENRIENVKGAKGSILATVKVPMPTGEKPILEMQIPNLASSNFYKSPLDSANWKSVNATGSNLGSVVEEKLPISVSYDLAQHNFDINVDSTIVHPENLPKPPSEDKPYIFIAGVKTTVSAEKTNFNVDGQIDVKLDVDGQATQGKIDTLSQMMQGKGAGEVRELSQQKLMLQNRQIEARGLKGRLDKAGITDTLQGVMKDQSQKVNIPVTLPSGSPLAESTHYFWLGPDKDADGMADVYITQEMNLSGFEQVKLGEMDTARVSQDREKAGVIAEVGNKVVANQISSEMKNAAKTMEAEMKGRVQEAIKKTAASSIPNFEEVANTYLTQFIGNHDTLKANTGIEGIKDNIPIKLAGFNVVNNQGQTQAVAKIQLGNYKGDVKAGISRHLEETSRTLQAGHAAAAVDGHLINSMLRDQSEGGVVDWSVMTKEMTADGPIEKIAFNKDAKGNVVYPRIVMKDGKPCINIDATLTLKGKGALEGIGDVAGSATGAVSDGAGFITDNTIGQLGEGGKIASEVVKTPFKVVDFLVNGAKDVVDSTIGQVVDAAPKYLTGSNIRVNVNVPINIVEKNGSITVEGLSKGVEITDSRFASEIGGEELIPTRAIVSSIAKLAATSAPELALGSEKPVLSRNVSLQDQGLDVQKIQFSEGSQDQYKDTIPNVVIQASPNSQAGVIVAELLN